MDGTGVQVSQRVNKTGRQILVEKQSGWLLRQPDYWSGNSQGFRRPQIDRQVHLRRLLDGKIPRLCASQDLIHVGGALRPRSKDVRAVLEKPAAYLALVRRTCCSMPSCSSAAAQCPTSPRSITPSSDFDNRSIRKDLLVTRSARNRQRATRGALAGGPSERVRRRRQSLTTRPRPRRGRATPDQTGRPVRTKLRTTCANSSGAVA